MSIFQRLSQQILEIDKVSTGTSLSTSTSPTAERISPIKAWNKFKKMPSVPSRELKPNWWAGSTIKNIAI